jgi:hypothetical protein
MKNKFNIPALYQSVWGIAGVRYVLPKLLGNVAETAIKVTEFTAGQRINEAADFANAAQNKKPLYEGIQIIPLPATGIKSALGTPIYEQITLTVPTHDLNDIKTSNEPVVYTFPDWPLFDISPAWQIVNENMRGGTGTQKEFVSQHDSQITIRGFLINYASQDYPEQLLSDLWAVINSKKSLLITSRVFNLMDIHNIIIQDAKFPTLEGYMNVQPFELNCISDRPVILQIKSVKTQRPISPDR